MKKLNEIVRSVKNYALGATMFTSSLLPAFGQQESVPKIFNDRPESAFTINVENPENVEVYRNLGADMNKVVDDVVQLSFGHISREEFADYFDTMKNSVVTDSSGNTVRVLGDAKQVYFASEGPSDITNNDQVYMFAFPNFMVKELNMNIYDASFEDTPRKLTAFVDGGQLGITKRSTVLDGRELESFSNDNLENLISELTQNDMSVFNSLNNPQATIIDMDYFLAGADNKQEAMNAINQLFEDIQNDPTGKYKDFVCSYIDKPIAVFREETGDNEVSLDVLYAGFNAIKAPYKTIRTLMQETGNPATGLLFRLMDEAPQAEPEPVKSGIFNRDSEPKVKEAKNGVKDLQKRAFWFSGLGGINFNQSEYVSTVPGEEGNSAKDAFNAIVGLRLGYNVPFIEVTYNLSGNPALTKEFSQVIEAPEGTQFGLRRSGKVTELRQNNLLQKTMLGSVGLGASAQVANGFYLNASAGVELIEEILQSNGKVLGVDFDYNGNFVDNIEFTENFLNQFGVVGFPINKTTYAFAPYFQGGVTAAKNRVSAGVDGRISLGPTPYTVLLNLGLNSYKEKK